MNNSAKGSRMEAKCLEELKLYLAAERPEVMNEYVTEWKTYRSRAGGNDLFGDAKLGITGFDIGLLTKGLVILVQVDDAFSSTRYSNLMLHWASRHGIECYYAVYNKRPKLFGRRGDSQLPSFWLLRV